MGRFGRLLAKGVARAPCRRKAADDTERDEGQEQPFGDALRRSRRSGPPEKPLALATMPHSAAPTA